MTNEQQKNQLLAEFQQFLDQTQHESLQSENLPGLNTLLNEMSALKTEVKTESRQYKKTLETLSSTLESVQSDNKTLTNQLSSNAELLKQQRDEIVRRMILDLIEIYDRMLSSVEVLQNYRPVSTLFKKSREKDVRFIERFQQGQQLSLKRFEQLLQRYQVQAIECVGKMFDPNKMSAVEIGSDAGIKAGIVLEELRKGFLFNDQVLRLAEVKVNKMIDG